MAELCLTIIITGCKVHFLQLCVANSSLKYKWFQSKKANNFNVTNVTLENLVKMTED